MSKKRGSRVTLADVAALAGLSQSAVSLILNDRPGTRLSADAAERVRAAAAELGYRPNPVAQSLRSGKTLTIGMISDHVTITRYASSMIVGAIAAAKEHRHAVLMAETGGEPDALAEAVAMLDRRVDGVLIALLGARMIDVPEMPSGTPVVVINGRTSADHPSILPDEREAGLAVAQAVLDAGHRRVGLLGERDEARDERISVTLTSRFGAINETLAAAGVEPVRAPMSRWTPATGYEATRRLMAEHPGTTALIAANDNIAFGVYQALSELRLDIPGDVSVISFDDEEIASYHRPGLTTARLPYQEMARIGVDMVLGARPREHTLVPMPLIWRGSLGPVAGHSISPVEQPLATGGHGRAG